ncbi:MAG: FHA domain-containing protein [Polyangiaceae bacterium]|nr:FHA domain-containing protein [Polyangiaceae bacterium]
MAFFDKIFGKNQSLDAAKAAELRGDLARAAELYGQTGQPEQAARIMLLRGDSEREPRLKLQFYAQASLMVPMSPQAAQIRNEARRKHAELLLALAGGAAASAALRHEIVLAARELEDLGEPLKAAEAYARAGDIEGEARTLQAAGDIERLEFLLASEEHKEHRARALRERAKDVDLLISCGQRREALAALDDLLHGSAGKPPSVDEASLRERASSLRARRAMAPIVAVEVDSESVFDSRRERIEARAEREHRAEQPAAALSTERSTQPTHRFRAAGCRTRSETWKLVLGNEVVVGRSEGSIKVMSSAVSRRHLRIAREAAGVVVQDLQSRNGTQFRGTNLAGMLPMNDELDLRLGREVPLQLLPSRALGGAVEIEVGGECYLACLGRTLLLGERFELVEGPDGWIELVALGAPAFLGDVELVAHATLLTGDAIASERGAPAALRILST